MFLEPNDMGWVWGGVGWGVGGVRGRGSWNLSEIKNQVLTDPCE